MTAIDGYRGTFGNRSRMLHEEPSHLRNRNQMQPSGRASVFRRADQTLKIHFMIQILHQLALTASAITVAFLFARPRRAANAPFGLTSGTRRRLRAPFRIVARQREDAWQRRSEVRDDGAGADARA